jgi:hypothetical protein
MIKINYFKFLLSTTLVFFSFTFIVLSANQKEYNVRNYGAKGDGVTLDTDALNKAIEACSKAGGGIVLLPKGTYLTGTVFLQSSITLFLDEGSIIKGIHELNKYTPFSDRNWHRALVLAVNVENVTITGNGIIDGDNVSDPFGEVRMRGPHLVLFGNSKNVIISDITLQHGGNYHFLGEGIENFSFKNLSINGGWDGIHVRDGKDITIANCEIHSGDDAIAGGHWENFIITNNILNSSCNGIRLIGPATNLQISKSRIYGPGRFEHRSYKSQMRRNTYCAIALQPGTWGKQPGVLEKITIQDITIEDVESAFTLILNEENYAKEILIERIRAINVTLSAFSIESWVGGTFEDVTLRDVKIEYLGSDHVGNAVIHNLRRPGIDPRPLPCWAFFALNVNKLTMEDVEFKYRGNEIRRAFIFQNIKQLNLKNVKYSEVKNVRSSIFENVEEINTGNVYPALNIVR